MLPSPPAFSPDHGLLPPTPPPHTQLGRSLPKMKAQHRQPLTSAREATAALRQEPPQRGTSGVRAVAALHAAARPQRSRMARGARRCGSAAGRPPRPRGPGASSQPRPSLPALLSRTAATTPTFWEPGPPWGEGEGPVGRAALGAEFQSPAVCPSPAGSVAQSLMQGRSGRRHGARKGRRSVHKTGAKQVLPL